MRTYRQLFGVGEFRAIFAVQCLAVGAASVSSLALGTVTYSATGNPVLTGLAMFGGPLIRMVASWFLVSASDLVRPRTALAALAVVTCGADLPAPVQAGAYSGGLRTGSGRQRRGQCRVRVMFRSPVSADIST